MAGAVASAVRFIAKASMTGTLSRIIEGGNDEQTRGHLTAEKGEGIGQPLISRFLEHIPGVTDYVVRQQLLNLRASGDYARILEEVEEEIRLEEQAAHAALIVAEQRRREAEEEERRAEQDRKDAEGAIRGWGRSTVGGRGVMGFPISLPRPTGRGCLPG